MDCSLSKLLEESRRDTGICHDLLLSLRRTSVNLRHQFSESVAVFALA